MPDVSMPEGLIVYFTKVRKRCMGISISEFQCPEGLIVYFTPASARQNHIRPSVSMPRRAHFVFHPWMEFTSTSSFPSFNAPKGSFCISPE